MRLLIKKKTNPVKFDEGTFYKYNCTIINADFNQVVQQFSFWYHPDKNFFADNLIVKYNKKNPQTTEVEKHLYLGGIVSQDCEEVFTKSVDSKYRKFVVRKINSVFL